ncbi:thioredoxin domain-containing protein [Paenarthrobacter sp. DKR-5]|uniref:DsbA family protein n=1 Tax=Paenarthrobacter sp. DKR-5 TaxID=2835535 RepID=UPI001BDC871D|nr:thioredoxin domain-containing protein [Paenarthrobacter sp. DKR-5]MBT1004381.1 thioredoxin domain-containing protein [Paenarthrobacter sp. DKR-5]
MSPQNDRKPTKAERTAEAREKARQIREEQKRKEKRNKLLIRSGVLVALVAVVAVIALIVTTNLRSAAPIADNGPTPANANAHGGVVLGAKNTVSAVSASTISMSDVPTSAPSPTAPGAAVVPPGVAKSPAGKPVQIVAYVDFICPVCQRFEQQYGADLTKWRDAGQATVEYRALGFLDQNSTTKYSSRAANAAACVANSSPTKYADFFNALYAQQPAEGSAGLSNDQLKKIAADAGAGDIGSCVDSGTYRPYVKAISAEAQAYGITGTPTVFVDGQKWDGSTDFKAFVDGIIKAKK